MHAVWSTTRSACGCASTARTELAHYAKQATDIEYQVPGMGWKEWEGIHWRGDWDLSRHSQYSGQDLSYTDPATNERYMPWIVETSGGVDRTFFYLLVDAYDEEVVNGETRTVLRLHKQVAPYKVAVLPLSKKPELSEPAREIWRTLAAPLSPPSTTRRRLSAAATAARTRSARPTASPSTSSRSKTRR